MKLNDGYYYNRIDCRVTCMSILEHSRKEMYNLIMVDK